MMLFLPYLPYSENENFRIGPILAGIMWGLLIIVPVFSCGLFIHFKIIEHDRLWGRALLFTCPILIALSYSLRGGLLKGTPEKIMPYRWITPAYPSSTTSFWFQFWLQQSGVIIIGMICCFVLATIVSPILIKSGILLIFTLFLLFVIPAFSVVWGDAIRALRTLPVTTRKLGYFLLLIPTVNILCITILMISFNLGAGRIHSYWDLLLSFAPAIYAVCISIIVTRLTLSYGKRSGTAFLLIIFFTCLILLPIYLFLIPVLGISMFPGIKEIIRRRSETYRHARWSGIEDSVDNFEDIEEDLLLTRGIEYCHKCTDDEQDQRTLF